MRKAPPERSAMEAVGMAGVEAMVARVATAESEAATHCSDDKYRS